jgi:hypothetical protein
MEIEFDRFFKNAQISNFMKIHLVGTELFHIAGLTDRHNKAVTFHNFVKFYKNKRDFIFT